jgi:hypothetical protein
MYLSVASSTYSLIVCVERDCCALLHTRTHAHGRTPPGDESTHRRDNTKHPKETDIHTPGGIRTHNTSKRVVADNACCVVSVLAPMYEGRFINNTHYFFTYTYILF